MKLLDLPIDIINILPNYLASIHDLYSVLLTCRTLYTAYHDSEFKLPPILPKPDGQPLFQPYPHLLLTILARQIGDWAVSSSSHRYELYQSLLLGHHGLLSLAERVAVVSLSDLRHLNEIKYSVLNPLTRLVDFEVGPAMVRNQDMDPAKYGLTFCQCPDLAVMNHVVYCELFHHYIDEILASAGMTAEEQEYTQSNDVTKSCLTEPPPPHPTNAAPIPRPLEAGIRNHFIAYCLPDTNNHRNPAWKTLGQGRGHDDEWQLLDYLEMSRCHAMLSRDRVLRRYWHTGVLQALPEDEAVGHDGHAWDWTPSREDKREGLFVLVVGHLGYESLGMLLFNWMNNPTVVARLKTIRSRLRAIPDVPIDRWEYWSHAETASDTLPEEQHYDTEWQAWQGMPSDCDNGMSTNQESDVDLRAEAEACRSLLKLRMSAERLGIVE